MQGSTHRRGGMFCAIVGFFLLKWNNLLLANVSSIIQLLIIYPFASWASVASDLDHHWDSCPDKNVPNYIINKLLHITTPFYRKMKDTLPASVKRNSLSFKLCKLLSANHRSWQTHSDLTMLLIIFILRSVLHGKFFNMSLSPTEACITSLVMIGICIGFSAHFILDMLTPSGIWSVIGILINKALKMHVLPEKIRFVPKSKYFATGGIWEQQVNKVLTYLTFIATFILLVDFIDPDALLRIRNYFATLRITF